MSDDYRHGLGVPAELTKAGGIHVYPGKSGCRSLPGIFQLYRAPVQVFKKKEGAIMKKIALLIGIVCLFVFLGCGQEEKAEAPAQQETREAAESVKETPGETAEELKQKAAETVK